MTLHKQAIFALLVSCWSYPVFAVDVPVMVRSAIDQGYVVGVVEGEVAVKARSALNATGSLHLEIRKIYDFDEPGCARLQLSFTQDGALLPHAELPSSYSWQTQMNVCLDGSAPTVLKRKE